MIGFDYKEVINAYDFFKEYEQILEHIYLGEIGKAETLYYKCVEKEVFKTLGVLNFSLVSFVLSAIDSIDNQCDDACMKSACLLNSDQIAVWKLAESMYYRNDGDYVSAIEALKDAEQYSYKPKIRAWIYQLFGIYYIYSGNYAEATVALLEARNRYADYLGIIRMIQVNLNLGNVYALTRSYAKAEESYMIAYERAKKLKESTRLLTRCFNSLCWLYFETSEYDKVQNLLSNKPDELVESRNTYYILAWACYKLGKKEDAVKYCIAGQKKFKEYSYVCMIYEYIEKACLGKKTGQEALLKKIISTEDYDHDALTERLFAYELMDLYESRGNYEKAYKTAKKLLNR